MSTSQVIPQLNVDLSKHVVTPKSFIMPATLIGVGALVFASSDLKEVNDLTKDIICRNGSVNKLKIDNYTMGIPAVGVYALNLAGIKGKHNLLDRTILLGMSSAICNGIVFSTKKLTNISRPDGSDKRSFPSGHTAQAFVAAEFMRQEYKHVSPWYGAAGYAIAIGNGLLRIYHDKHWLNDVIAGAGVGILSTRFSYWLYPKIKEKFFQGKDQGVLLAPVYNDGAYGLSLVYSF